MEYKDANGEGVAVSVLRVDIAIFLAFPRVLDAA